MDPATGMLLGSGISAFGQLLGGRGGDSGPSKYDVFLERERHAENIALQREFAQHGIRWRVEDAQAAGLHPLFALGGAGAAYSPQSYVAPQGRSQGRNPIGAALSEMGQGLSRAVSAQETADQREARQMALAVQASQIRENDARALYYTNEASRASRVGATPFPVSDRFNIPSTTLDQVQIKPDEVVSRRFEDPSTGAGLHPGMQEFAISPHGLQLRLPRGEEGSLGESIENVPWYGWPALVAHNMSYYGPDWGRRFLKEFVYDQAPSYRSSGVRSGSMVPPRSYRSSGGRSTGGYRR